MQSLVTRNAVVAAAVAVVPGGVYGMIFHLQIGRGGAGRSRPEILDIAHDPGVRGVARLNDESRRDLSRALFTS